MRLAKEGACIPESSRSETQGGLVILSAAKDLKKLVRDEVEGSDDGLRVQRKGKSSI
jgi:hypothetical protein